jgi:hypothetical protein
LSVTKLRFEELHDSENVNDGLTGTIRHPSGLPIGNQVRFVSADREQFGQLRVINTESFLDAEKGIARRIVEAVGISLRRPQEISRRLTAIPCHEASSPLMLVDGGDISRVTAPVRDRGFAASPTRNKLLVCDTHGQPTIIRTTIHDHVTPPKIPLPILPDFGKIATFLRWEATKGPAK